MGVLRSTPGITAMALCSFFGHAQLLNPTNCRLIVLLSVVLDLKSISLIGLAFSKEEFEVTACFFLTLEKLPIARPPPFSLVMQYRLPSTLTLSSGHVSPPVPFTTTSTVSVVLLGLLLSVLSRV